MAPELQPCNIGDPWMDRGRQVRWRRHATDDIKKWVEPRSMSAGLERPATRPPLMAALEATIQAAQSMLDLQEDWDDEGALRIDRKTWDRAIGFLRRTASQILQEGRDTLALPAIRPFADGSIDIHWKNSQFELLLNIPPADRDLGDFYGETANGLTIKGTFRPEVHDSGILSWLVNNG